MQHMHCKYSKELLDKLKKFDQLDLTEISKSMIFAKNYHNGQNRDSGEPFYSHPFAVAGMVADYCPKTHIIITAILHDTIEDTHATSEIIGKEFGIEVAQNVMDLTRIKNGDSKISSSEMVRRLWIKKKYELLLIKQFDRLHNIQTLASKSGEKIKKTIQETIYTFTVLAVYLGIRNVEEEIINLCSLFLGEYELHDLMETRDLQLLSLIFQNAELHKQKL